MKLKALEIDGFGVWSGLKIQRLSDGLNVLYGPNEAGKSTLLQFIRSVLYGFSPSRRKYFPPIRGGRPGGWVEVTGPNGHFQIDRHEDLNQPGQEQLLLTAADGTRQGEHIVKILLSNTDEATFNNVFAVGLREIQELGTISDTEAAELLYSLTAGLDRVSLLEVMRALEASRNRILDRSGGPCQVVQMLAEREKLRLEIEGLQSLTRNYARLAAERGQLDREITRLEEENNQAEYQARVIDLALGLRDRWARRAAVEEELAALGSQSEMPADAVERLDAILARLQKRQQKIEQLDRQRELLRKEAAGLTANENLGRQAARIEALQEQETWITAVQNQVGELEKEIAEIQSSLAGEHKRLGLGEQTLPEDLPAFSPRTLGGLRMPGRTMRQCHERFRKAQQEAVAADETARGTTQQIEAALGRREDRDLAAAMDRAGNLVAQFRRRLQIDERLDQMTRYEGELEEQNRHLVEHQLLPGWVLVALGVVFSLGVLLLIAGAVVPAALNHAIGWQLALVGALGMGGAGLGKVLLERSSAQRLDGCHKQMSMLELQIKQAKEERESLDEQLPRGSGPITSRLAAAEKDLEELENLVPQETKRSAARQEAAAAAQRAAQAEQDLTAARRRWRDSLSAVGLPAKLTPRQVRQLMRRCEQIGQLQRRLAHRRDDLAQRRRELDLLLGRIAQVVADAGVQTGGNAKPLEQLRQLAEALGKQQAALARREAIRRQLRQFRRKRARHEEVLSRLRQLRRELLRESGARDEAEFRRQAIEAARAAVLRRDRDALDRDIMATVAQQCPQEAIRQQLEGDAAGGIQLRREELLARLEVTRRELQERFEKRGQLAEQMKVLIEDRQLGLRQLELATLEKRLDDAVRRWQVLAVTCRILEKIRNVYEHERQPETLKEASGYLDRLTQGRYRRVWTPLGESVLRVDDAEGHSLPVEVLSRGTREQLFLSLRLALAACYARRGAPLPLVLDDVLVNFDAERAKAAANVLRDFAAAGHQVLVFTCHEHILRLFKSLKVPASQLPDNAEARHAPIILEESPQEKPKRGRKPTPAPAPRLPAMKAKPPEPEEDLSEEPDEPEEASEVQPPSEEEALWDEEDWDEEDDDDEEEDYHGTEAAA